MHCSFCQNHRISMGNEDSVPWSEMSPETLAEKAAALQSRGNIGVAFTYNEPCVGFEYVRDTGRLVHERGMKNVLVTNGCVEDWVADALLPYMDAMNIDLKAFSPVFYAKHGGQLETVKHFIEKAAAVCHVELTMLVIPGENDDLQPFAEMIDWIAGIDRKIPLHISRFFPQWKMLDKEATSVDIIYDMADRARRRLAHVYPGNC